MTQRTETVETHKGQMALPGGGLDPGEDALMAALRETEEEVGIDRGLVEVLGRLPDLTTVTGFQVTPVVGVLREEIVRVSLSPNAHEIAEAFWIPWSVLTHPDTYRRELLRVGPVQYPTHVYQVKHYRIWGATGSMIKNLLDRVEALG
jgi:8-oxo-dGTP pyrophosphatase MutT (NUDIX family)